MMVVLREVAKGAAVVPVEELVAVLENFDPDNNLVHRFCWVTACFTIIPGTPFLIVYLMWLFLERT